jgi:hypothetical protein
LRVVNHRFEACAELRALAYVKAVLRAPCGTVTPRKLLAAVGQADVESPVLPEAMRQWLRQRRDHVRCVRATRKWH